MSDSEITVGDRIQRFRIEAGLTKYALARKIGTSDVSIGYWERGITRTVNHLLLMRLAEALDVTVSELVGDPQLYAHEADLLSRHAESLQVIADSAPAEVSSGLMKAAEYLQEEAEKRRNKIPAT